MKFTDADTQQHLEALPEEDNHPAKGSLYRKMDVLITIESINNLPTG
jgi:hypothetical protein